MVAGLLTLCIGKPGGIQCSPSYSASSDHSIACISSERLCPVCVCVCVCVCARAHVRACRSNLGNDVVIILLLERGLKILPLLRIYHWNWSSGLTSAFQ